MITALQILQHGELVEEERLETYLFTCVVHVLIVLYDYFCEFRLESVVLVKKLLIGVLRQTDSSLHAELATDLSVGAGLVLILEGGGHHHTVTGLIISTASVSPGGELVGLTILPDKSILCLNIIEANPHWLCRL